MTLLVAIANTMAFSDALVQQMPRLSEISMSANGNFMDLHEAPAKPNSVIQTRIVAKEAHPESDMAMNSKVAEHPVSAFKQHVKLMLDTLETELGAPATTNSTKAVPPAGLSTAATVPL